MAAGQLDRVPANGTGTEIRMGQPVSAEEALQRSRGALAGASYVDKQWCGIEAVDGEEANLPTAATEGNPAAGRSQLRALHGQACGQVRLQFQFRKRMQGHAPARIDRDQRLAIEQKTTGFHLGCERIGGYFLASLQVPKLQRLVARTRSEVSSVGRHRRRGDAIAMASE